MNNSRVMDLVEKVGEKGEIIIGSKVKNPLDVLRWIAKKLGVPVAALPILMTKGSIEKFHLKSATEKWTPLYDKTIKEFQKIYPIKKLPFYVIPSPHPNAFCLGNHLIAFTHTFFNNMSEDTFKFVLAHEITHAIDEHVYEQAFIKYLLNAAIGSGMLLYLAALVIPELMSTLSGLPGVGTLLTTLITGGTAVTHLASVIVSVIVLSLTSAYSRTGEREADMSAVNLIKKTYGKRFNWENVYNFFAEMKNVRMGARFFSSHPPALERIKSIKKKLRERKLELRRYIFESLSVDKNK
jgi:Zn-dependent protease with chaperone function